MISALESLQRLKDGNARFAANVRGLESFLSQERRAQLAKQQAPHAIILGCSDSRVPAEIIFDQGLGDLFVIRVAGNIVAPSQVGSVEYAAEQFGTRLVVVLGHSRCGAILATLDQLQRPVESQSPNLRSIVDRVRPSVASLLDTPLKGDYVFADASGAVVIPAGDVHAVLHAANEIVAADAASIATIRGETANAPSDGET